MPPPPTWRGGGNIVFGPDPVSVGVASCMHSLLKGYIDFSQIAHIHHWVGRLEKNRLDLGDMGLILKVTRSQRMLKNVLSELYLL